MVKTVATVARTSALLVSKALLALMASMVCPLISART